MSGVDGAGGGGSFEDARLLVRAVCLWSCIQVARPQVEVGAPLVETDSKHAVHLVPGETDSVHAENLQVKKARASAGVFTSSHKKNGWSVSIRQQSLC